ncbi:MAG: hypothetical protein A2X94_16855 [Bdellovibrionales bacterium GWB1_55_8]|nr:MAG: hypothetical protein A2X94_16855 [Bdellovibrionales bacterium GWB1_55_8]
MGKPAHAGIFQRLPREDNVIKNTVLPSLLAGLITLAPSLSHSSPTIAGGTEVPPGHIIARTTVALLMDVADGQALCTGSIIEDDIILTAAHCIDGAIKTTIVFGTELRKARHVTLATATFVAPGYRTNAKTPDIALVRFEGGLPAGYETAEIMPSTRSPKKRERVILAGYGITSMKEQKGSGVLRQVEQTITSSSGPQAYEVTVTQRGKTGACPGDSGGPAYTENGHQLFGIASRIFLPFISPCGVRAVYTNANHPEMRQLIQTEIENLRKLPSGR